MPPKKNAKPVVNVVKPKQNAKPVVKVAKPVVKVAKPVVKVAKPVVQRTPMVVNIQQQPGGFKQAIVGGFGAGVGLAIGNEAFGAIFD